MDEGRQPKRSIDANSVPDELRESLMLFHNLTTDEEVLHAFSRAGLVMLGRPPSLAEYSLEDRDALKHWWGATTDDEVSEILTLGEGLVTISVRDLPEATRAARHPLIVAKAIMGAIRRLETQLHDVVPVLRERGCSWNEIGVALGITKQSAWERFADED